MTYDFRGQLDEFASHHSALYSGSYEEGEQKVFNTVSQKDSSLFRFNEMTFFQFY
jgi:GH18 family chitinase